jgi:hypothetical protein
MGTYSSVSRQGAYEPFELQVARGQIAGHTGVQIFGYSAAIGASAQGPMWEGQTQSGGLYTPPASAAPLILVSSSASDTSALSVKIDGLDSSYTPISETIAMNGVTNVTTTKSFLRINMMTTTNGTNVGTITAKISTTLYAQINAGIGQTQASIYTVPAGYTLYLLTVQYDAAIGFTSSAYMTAQEYNKDNVSGHLNILNQTVFVQKQEQNYATPIPHTEKTDIQFCVKASAGGPLSASVAASGILIKNPD